MTDSEMLARFGKLPETDPKILHFRDWAEAKGYPYCEVLDWESNTGDWKFIISKDNKCWQIMTQYSNFLRGINRDKYYGTAEEVLQLLKGKR